MRWVSWRMLERQYYLNDDGVWDVIPTPTVVRLFRNWLITRERHLILIALKMKKRRLARIAYGCVAPTPREAALIAALGGPPIMAWLTHAQALTQPGVRVRLHELFCHCKPVNQQLYPVEYSPGKGQFIRSNRRKGDARLPLYDQIGRPVKTRKKTHPRLKRKDNLLCKVMPSTHSKAFAVLQTTLLARGWTAMPFPVATPEGWISYINAPDDVFRFCLRERSVHYSLPPHPALDDRFNRIKGPDPRGLTVDQYLTAIATSRRVAALLPLIEESGPISP